MAVRRRPTVALARAAVARARPLTRSPSIRRARRSYSFVVQEVRRCVAELSRLERAARPLVRGASPEELRAKVLTPSLSLLSTAHALPIY